MGGRLVGVSGPPEIDPVVVKLRSRDLVRVKHETSLHYLMVCDQKHAGSKVAS